jgi:site-specific DNA recombinase
MGAISARASAGFSETVDELIARIKTGGGHSTVWGYVRVSTEGQEEGESPDAQAQAIEKFCRDKGMKAPNLVFEQGSAKESLFSPSFEGGGSYSGYRPKLLILLAHVERTPLGALVVWKMDRLARLVQDQEVIFTKLSAVGVSIHSTYAGEQDLTKDTSDPTRVLFRQLIGAFAQYERANIEARTKLGLRHKAGRGGWTGGMIPYGYVHKDRELVIHPFRAEIVKYIFKLRYDYGASIPKITEQLKSYPNKEDPTEWYDQKVLRILKHKHLYLGVYRNCYGERHSRPDLRILSDDWKHKIVVKDGRKNLISDDDKITEEDKENSDERQEQVPG